jgi:hypothetical protein
MRILVAATVIALAAMGGFAARDAYAWGKFGHLTVCDLAYRNLTDPSKAELKRLFKAGNGGIFVEGRGKLDDRTYTSFNVGCLEEDALPRRHADDHFLNVPRTTTSIESASCTVGASCVFAGIERDLAILADRSQSDDARVFALMAVGHWIGDLHQPLHISFADDLGGNRITVELDGRCGRSSGAKPKNLHAVWDNCLQEAGMFERVRERADFKKSWSKNTITYRAVDTLLVNTSLTEEKALVGTDLALWANESYQITIDPNALYCVKVGPRCNYSENADEHRSNDDERSLAISQQYLEAFDRVAEDLVRRAGFRLAHLMNIALDPSYREPIQNSTQIP